MKKLIILRGLGLSMATLLFCSACSLDEPPQNKITKNNAFLTEQNLNTTTTAIHAAINIQMAGTDLKAFLDAGELKDELSSGNAVRNWNPRIITSNLYDWASLYDIIFEGHYLLDNIHQTKGLSEDRLNYHRGQALFALGLGYLTLVQRYGDVILLDNSERLSAYPLTPQLEVLNKAIEYAKEAYDILPTYDKLKDYSGQKIRNKQIASKGSAAALLAELYAWKGSVIDNYKLTSENSRLAYESSIQYASEVIGGRAGNYQLNASPEALVQKLSNPEADDSEVIYAITFDRTRSAEPQTPSPARFYTSWPVDRTSTLGEITDKTEYRLYKQTIKRLYSDAQDKRLSAFFYKIDQNHQAGVDAPDYALINKWREAIFTTNTYSERGEQLTSINTDFTYWRLAEMYLLRAECYNKIGQTANAVQDLNVIRQRAGANAYPYNGESDLKKAIFQEQEKEFIGEGSRYWSVIRNGYWKTELQGNFSKFTDIDVQEGALHLPTPEGSFKKDGLVINTLIRQSKYWSKFK